MPPTRADGSDQVTPSMLNGVVSRLPREAEVPSPETRSAVVSALLVTGPGAPPAWEPLLSCPVMACRTSAPDRPAATTADAFQKCRGVRMSVREVLLRKEGRTGQKPAARTDGTQETHETG
ncbi:hypothetical protein SHKM778_51610 [Streptomyces sp. KM77-8]|uniref:Uncharacterized protein n=1 Tax=Streptomyces haneummycinicus TaxID=3074435 RepID=A0AAT9HNX8_9ACTN